jgi:hypothetical protein
MYIAWAEVRDAPCACILQPSNHRTRPEVPELTFHARVLCHARRSVIWSLILTERSLSRLRVPRASENGLPPATRCRCRLVLALRFSRQGACHSAVLWLTDRDALQALDADTAGRSYWPLTSS